VQKFESRKPTLKTLGVVFMRLYVPIFLLSSFMIAGCRKTENNLPSTNSAQTTAEQANAPSSSPAPAGQPAPATAAVKPKIDACALLTSQEIQSIQGEPLKETKLSGQSAGGFPVSQCFFTLPTFTNSISLLITQKAETAGARNPSEFWRETFHKERKERDEIESARKSGKRKKKNRLLHRKSLALAMRPFGWEAGLAARFMS
jgi:hypothetical protein